MGVASVIKQVVLFTGSVVSQCSLVTLLSSGLLRSKILTLINIVNVLAFLCVCVCVLEPPVRSE